ncbi:hypothetical protein EG68_11734 [Paragonimus skrjabini miyazakii]|uniref:alkaline phosphatase n=1 Tax=Paragonimus skrjabini miyazakii TaxID=59628 RepID=A0A8S9YIS5_9TREM|nr:hypothetical protein EG68_11734 [Paragonimus skrjabini miyazakii]
MILFVGDGLSSSTITGARYLKAANMNKSAGDVVLDWELWPAISLLHTFSANRMTTDSAASATALLCGLTAQDHLDYEIHRTDQPSLAEMTEKGIKFLSRNPKGYLLLVEGGRIDHGHHSNQARYALTEMLALEKAVSTAMSRVSLNETLMVVTADHSHAYGVIGYGNRRRHVLDLDNSRLGSDGYPYFISAYFSGPGGSAKQPRRDPSNDRIFEDGYRQQALVPLSSATHAADGVPLYAIGPLSQLFHRSMDNTYVAHATTFALCLEGYQEEPHCIRRNVSPKRYVCPYQLLFLIGAQIVLTSVM